MVCAKHYAEVLVRQGGRHREPRNTEASFGRRMFIESSPIIPATTPLAQLQVILGHPKVGRTKASWKGD